MSLDNELRNIKAEELWIINCIASKGRMDNVKTFLPSEVQLKRMKQLWEMEERILWQQQEGNHDKRNLYNK